jgi:hypothetical protein
MPALESMNGNTGPGIQALKYMQKNACVWMRE